MVSDIVGVFDGINSILIANIWKFIIIPILDFISGNKIYWVTVEVFSLSLSNDWHHMAIKFHSAIGMVEDTAGK